MTTGGGGGRVLVLPWGLPNRPPPRGMGGNVLSLAVEGGSTASERDSVTEPSAWFCSGLGGLPHSAEAVQVTESPPAPPEGGVAMLCHGKQWVCMGQRGPERAQTDPKTPFKRDHSASSVAHWTLWSVPSGRRGCGGGAWVTVCNSPWPTSPVPMG